MNILITGASRGIGLEFARQYVAAGHRVYACVRSKTDALYHLAEQSSGLLSFHKLDVTDHKNVCALAKELHGTPIDILINNAGVLGGDHQSFRDMDYSAWLETFKTNTMAPLQMVEAFFDNLKLAAQPKVINISSQMGSLNRDAPGMIIYRSSKAALNKVMQTLALDLKKENIAVALIHPGWVKTDMGGQGADIMPEVSVIGIRRVIEGLNLHNTGKFFQWNGEEHAW